VLFYAQAETLLGVIKHHDTLQPFNELKVLKPIAVFANAFIVPWGKLVREKESLFYPICIICIFRMAWSECCFCCWNPVEKSRRLVIYFPCMAIYEQSVPTIRT
jgi:hypothetical protein